MMFLRRLFLSLSVHLHIRMLYIVSVNRACRGVYIEFTHQDVGNISCSGCCLMMWPVHANMNVMCAQLVIAIKTVLLIAATTVHVLQVPLAKMDGYLALQILSYYIVLFPSLDVISAYPLCVLTIANNLYLVFTGKDPDSDERRYAWVLRLLLKFVSSILPLVAGLFIANLVNVLQFAGLLGFSVCYLFPALFQLGSQYQCVKLFGASTAGDGDNSDAEDGALLQKEAKKAKRDLFRQWWLTYKNPLYWTSYSTPFSHPVAVVAMATVAFTLFVLTIASIVLSIQEHALQSRFANVTISAL